MRAVRPVLAYHLATRRAYLFAAQIEAARWLVESDQCKTERTARSNLIMATNRPGSYWGFLWAKANADETATPARMMQTIARKLRVRALQAVKWDDMADSELAGVLGALKIGDPADTLTEWQAGPPVGPTP